MNQTSVYMMKNLNSMFALGLCASILTLVGSASYVFAAATSNFTQTINPGTLAVDIVDASYVTVSSPSVAMSPVTVAFSCQTSTGIFGTNTERIYVSNPDAADNGWTVSLAASAPTSVWDSAGKDFDFNDPNASGCTDGGDADTLGGQMTVNPAAGTLTVGQCTGGCTTTDVTKGTSAAFNQGTVDSITVLTGAAGSSDVGDWKLTDVAISQKIPSGQPAGSDYNISLTLSVLAS